MPDYTAAHARAGMDCQAAEARDLTNRFPGYEITIRVPEYRRSVPRRACPITARSRFTTSRRNSAWG